MIFEEIAYAAAPNGFQTHSDVCIDYLLHYATDELKARWLPGTVDGTAIAAIAMTEPGAGSDLRGIRTKARREGDECVFSGSKTYISNGQNCDFVLTALKTAAMPDRLSLLLIETDREGFRRGRNLDKIGQNGAVGAAFDQARRFHPVELAADRHLGQFEIGGERVLLHPVAPRQERDHLPLRAGDAERLERAIHHHPAQARHIMDQESETQARVDILDQAVTVVHV